MKYFLALSLFVTSLAQPASAAIDKYIADNKESSISFSGIHAGNNFKGVFEKWDAEILYDADNLANSKITVTIDTSTAKTGDKLYDGTLPGPDWFDVKNHPKAIYISEAITKAADGTYTAKGTLTIREKKIPVEFSFKLDPADLATSPVKTNFSFTLNRLDFAIGESSDKDADWVSREIKMEITLVAQKK